MKKALLTLAVAPTLFAFGCGWNWADLYWLYDAGSTLVQDLHVFNLI